jgi:hypothetical protein
MVRQIRHWINEYHFRRSFKVAQSQGTLKQFQVPIVATLELNTAEGNEHLRQEILAAKQKRKDLFCEGLYIDGLVVNLELWFCTMT